MKYSGVISPSICADVDSVNQVNLLALGLAGAVMGLSAGRIQTLDALRRACFSLRLFLRVFSTLSARLLGLSVHDDGLRCFLVA